MSQEVEFPWEDLDATSAATNAHADADRADADAHADAADAAEASAESSHDDDQNTVPQEVHLDAQLADPVAAEPQREMPRQRPIARKEYYSIGEVSDLVGLPAHVLRYWETQFSVLNPSKNRSGNRAYQRKEIRLILLVKQLLYEDKYTVEGAKSKLEQLRKGGGLANASAGALDKELMQLLRQDIAALRHVLAGTGA
jgi:DNA-binding transcriptional MerR regulator